MCVLFSLCVFCFRCVCVVFSVKCVMFSVCVLCFQLVCYVFGVCIVFSICVLCSQLSALCFRYVCCVFGVCIQVLHLWATVIFSLNFVIRLIFNHLTFAETAEYILKFADSITKSTSDGPGNIPTKWKPRYCQLLINYYLMADKWIQYLLMHISGIHWLCESEEPNSTIQNNTLLWKKFRVRCFYGY